MAGVLRRDQWDSGWHIMNFETWFETATKNIAQSELPKLRNELENHVFEAVQAHQQIGMMALEAEQKAVLELGDPKIAARGFARIHLTKRDWRRIHSPSLGLRLFSLIFAVLWWIVWEQDILGVLRMLSHDSTVHLNFFRVVNIANIVLQVLLLVAQVQRHHFGTFQLRLGITLLDAALELAIVLAASLTPFTMPVWIFWMLVVLSALVYYTSEIPLLRKLQSRA
jgi:hypothetical protein